MAPLSGAKTFSLNRIAVGIDFSAESDVALGHAIELARSTNAQLTLVHVISLPADLTGDSSYDPLFRAGSAAAEMVTTEREQASALLTETAERCRGEGIAVESTIVEDNPSDGLARAADEAAADLLVLGSHGRTGIRRFLLGSVAERAIRMASASALVARPPQGQASYRRILVATDFSPHADRAVAAALAVASPDADIELVHCWQTPIMPSGMPMAPVRHDLTGAIGARGDAIVARHRAAGRTLRFVAVEAAPADGLASRAETSGADLIVTGSHGRRGVRRWLLGSVAESVVRHAHCSVLVVQMPPVASEDAA